MDGAQRNRTTTDAFSSTRSQAGLPRRTLATIVIGPLAHPATALVLQLTGTRTTAMIATATSGIATTAKQTTGTRATQGPRTGRAQRTGTRTPSQIMLVVTAATESATAIDSIVDHPQRHQLPSTKALFPTLSSRPPSCPSSSSPMSTANAKLA